jgi:pre-rRNA-processing protein RIX1
MSKVNLLRAVTQRLNQTPVKELPQIAYFLESLVLSCADVFKSNSGLAGKDDDTSFLVHKLKARITSLLQDRSAEGRFTAVVLVKATIQVGEREILASCEPWLRGLLAILNKSDPVPSKKLCLLAITHIFSLTQHYSTLIREITTPLLPAFVTQCMNLAALHTTQGDDGPSTRPSPYLETVLQCMLHLIPHHPSTFRPFATKLCTTLVKFIGSPSNSDHLTHLAQSVFVTLHFCAPKNTGGGEWANACGAVIESIHGIADQILRAVIEDWKYSNSRGGQPLVHKIFDDVPHSKGGGPLGFPPWNGVYQGSRVLVSLLHLLRTFLVEQTSQSVDLPLGLILDLTSRLSSVRVPSDSKEKQASSRFNPEIERSEREELFAILPQIQKSTLNLLSDLVDVTGLSVLPVSHVLLDQCLWACLSERSSEDVRLAAYELLGKLIPFTGTSTTKHSFKQLLEVADLCCKDVGSKSSRKAMTDQNKAGPDANPTVNGHADSFLQNASKRRLVREPEISPIENAASVLLCQLLGHVPAQSIPHSLRAQIDRTIIVNDQKRGMLASVLNPPPMKTGKFSNPSILPFLARTSQDELEIEGLLRPRMPLISGPKMSSPGSEADSVEDIEEQHFHGSETADRLGNGTPEQSTGNQSSTQKDLLDRLEDSIEDGPGAKPKFGTPQSTTTHQAPVDRSSEAKNGSLHANGFIQGVKRDIDKINVQEGQEPTKRFRSSRLEFEPDPASPLKETAAGAFAAASVVVDPDPVISVDTGVGASIIDKGKGRATTASPKPEGLGGFGSEMVDEESGSDLPPLYLKTSSEEEDEDEDEEVV